MGMPHSGSTSNWALYHYVEKDDVDAQTWARDCALLFYCRYHDDILAVCQTERGADKFISRFASRSNDLWKISCDAKSETSVDFLDMTVLISGDRLMWKPFIKPTARRLCLHPSSNHCWSIHRSWPLGEIRRMASRSALLEHFQEFRK